MDGVGRGAAIGMAAVLATAALFGAASSSLRRPSDAPVPEWREGPVRYIITKSEDSEYSDLRSEEDRRAFIESFWRRRDPTPDTPGNEYRAQFWKRVRDASSLYARESAKPGWITDMGKIHVLFGPPDEIQRDEVAEGRRGIVVWIYRNSPKIGEFTTLSGPNTVIAFAQDGTGDYRMTAEPSKVANVWEGLPDPQPPMGQMKFMEARREALQKAYARYIGLTDPVIRGAGGPPIETPLASTMTLGRLQQPPKEWSLKSEVSTREYFGNLPFRARADFFMTSGERSRVVLSVAVRSRSVTYRATPTGEKPSIEVFARILDSTATDQIMSLDPGVDFFPAPENNSAALEDDLVFQARALLRSGSYIARLTIIDQVSGRSSTSDTPFTVPDFTGDSLGMSTVALARAIQPMAEVPVRDAAFVIGRLRVIPRLGQDFRRDEDLSFYYQIYGARRDPQSQQPRLNVSYIFLAAEKDQFAEVGRTAFEGQTTEAHGYTVPLSGWPAGEYLVRVEVTDAIDGRIVTRDVLFRIVEGT